MATRGAHGTSWNSLAEMWVRPDDVGQGGKRLFVRTDRVSFREGAVLGAVKGKAVPEGTGARDAARAAAGRR